VLGARTYQARLRLPVPRIPIPNSESTPHSEPVVLTYLPLVISLYTTLYSACPTLSRLAVKYAVRCELETDCQIVAIGRNYADHAKELGNAIPKGMSFIKILRQSHT
jgi:2-keto-4-pentenoate hydratase/2-oxohepta-3-ene-1,7-dioic acid hydratase in catechol pathway